MRNREEDKNVRINEIFRKGIDDVFILKKIEKYIRGDRRLTKHDRTITIYRYIRVYIHTHTHTRARVHLSLTSLSFSYAFEIYLALSHLTFL